jgi:hypothetical protein
MTVDAKQPSEEVPPQISKEALSLEQLIEQKRYHALKGLLLAEEYDRLNSLEHYIHHPDAHIEKIAPLLAQAIRQANLTSIYQALELNTVVQDKIIESVQNDTAMYTDALYPVILPAIKKSIAEAFKEMMQSLNYAIEQGLSINRFAWHFEAWRSGVPYREVVLRHTLSYRVEQVFLIHRESGLLIRHVSSEGVQQLRDMDAVSGMLTAIQDFIKDSFSVNETDHLDTVEIGDYTVFLTRDAHVVLACVIQGIAPYSLRENFETALQTMNRLHGELLKNFDGDSDLLEPADAILHSCLLFKDNTSLKKKDPSIRNFAILLLFAMIGFGYWRYDYWQFQQRAEKYTHALQQTAGVIVTSHYYDGKKLIIKGLYDPLTINPQLRSSQFGLKKQQLNSQWQTYQSLEPFFVEQRLTRLLQPPSTVSLHVSNNTLILAGAANKGWLKKLALLTPIVTGVDKVDTRALKTYLQAISTLLQPPPTVAMEFKDSQLLLQGTASLDWIQSLPVKLSSLPFVQSYDTKALIVIEELQLQQLVAKLEKTSIYFANQQATPTEAELNDVALIADSIKQIQTLSVQLNKPLTIVVIGQTNSDGTTKLNQNLAQKRAQYMIEQLKTHGVMSGLKTEMKMDKKHEDTDKELHRKTSFKVMFTGDGQ